LGKTAHAVITNLRVLSATNGEGVVEPPRSASDAIPWPHLGF
jgi:hypothetical protein